MTRRRGVRGRWPTTRSWTSAAAGCGVWTRHTCRTAGTRACSTRRAGTLFCSDLFTHGGDPPALTDGDILGPAMAAEGQFGYTALTPATGATIHRLASLGPRTLA